MTFHGRSLAIFVVTTTFLCISFTAVALRCFVRLRLVKAFGRDDVLMVCAMAFNIWFAICGIVGSVYGIGQRFSEFDSLAAIHRALFWWWLGQSAYVWSVSLTKISIAVAILRFTVLRLHSAVMYLIISLTIVVDMAFWLILMLQCHPVREFWERTGRGHCIDKDNVIAIAYLYSATACVCDFTLVIFAAYLVKDLPMGWRTKWAVAGILSMGCVASAAVVVRIPFLHEYKDPDFLFASSYISIWSNVEAGLGITAGSLNTIRPLVRWFRDVSGIPTRQSSGSRTSSLTLNRTLLRRSKFEGGETVAEQPATGV